MRRKLRKFQRRVNIRPYKRIFYIFVEGNKTEPKYFNIFRTAEYSNVSLQIKSHPSKTHPKQVLSRAKKFIKDELLKKDYEVWLVVDDDSRPEADFQPLINWANGKAHFLAISKPCFELWLLLHFDEGNQIKNTEDCLKRLRKYMPTYEKNQLDEKKLKGKLAEAIKNGKNKYEHYRVWKNGVYTKVYELVENIVDTNYPSSAD